jgi:TolA-binding protein
MSTLRQTLGFVLLTGFVPTAMLLFAQTPTKGQTIAPSDAQVQELQEKIKSLQEQLDELNSAKDTTSRQRMMQQNWQSMQDYMGMMHDRWGMGYPWMIGGSSTGSGWPLPSGVDPNQYRQKMREQMQRMQEQMNKIAQTSNPQERQRLMQEHWQSMYQDMQTMRGMGWMWDGGPGMMGGRPLSNAKPLPEPTSQGARLVSTYCVQCHAEPQPSLHTAGVWSSATQRMRAHMSGGLQDIKIPTEQEMSTILSYMKKNAP